MVIISNIHLGRILISEILIQQLNRVENSCASNLINLCKNTISLDYIEVLMPLIFMLHGFRMKSQNCIRRKPEIWQSDEFALIPQVTVNLCQKQTAMSGWYAWWNSSVLQMLLTSGWLIYISVYWIPSAAGWRIRRELSISPLILNVYKSVLITVEGRSHLWVTIKGLHLRAPLPK